MGSLFRSEEMTLCQLFLQSEAAYACVSELGELGLVQFRDLNPEVNAFQRKFVNEVRRCDEMERKLRYLEKEIKKDGIPMLDTGENPEAPQPREMIDLEATFEKLENELREVNQNAEALKRNYLELTELKHILRKTQVFFDEADHGISPYCHQMSDPSRDEEQVTLLGEEGLRAGGQALKLGFVAGVILRERIPAFERMLWRACRGNVFLRQAEIENPLEDPSTGDQVFKSVFIIFFQGDQLKTRVKKICEGFRATLYPCPEAPADRREMAMGVMTRIEDLNTVLGQTQDHRHRVLVAAAKHIKNWFVKVHKIKAIYHTLNLFNLDVTQKCLIAECWVPVLDIETIQLALRRGTERSGSSVPPILNRMDTFEDPPTYNRTNKFTNAFQVLIDAYGVASYREVNPAPYTIITFPFLFAVMFGDMGHGLLMTCFAAWMVLREKPLIAKKIDNEIWTIIFGGRYILLLMGVFSIYTGLIYNDVFSKSINIFSSHWTVNLKKSDENMLVNSKFIELNPSSEDYMGIPYPIGMDPVWQMSQNKIRFLNSFKMKISIIFGVLHMLFGVCLSMWNYSFSFGIFLNNSAAEFLGASFSAFALSTSDHRFFSDATSSDCVRYFKKKMSVYTDFIPQIIFLVFLFFYMVILIFIKWMAYGPTNAEPYGPYCAPSILITFINMLLFKESSVPKECSLYMFSGQRYLQFILVVLALICVPWMLFAKPFLIMRSQKKQHHLLSNHHGSGENGDIEGGITPAVQQPPVPHKEEDENLVDMFVHQCIHTIEYVLGSVSHTASYLRLWALSLAHAQLSEVLWHMVLSKGLKYESWIGGVVLWGIFAFWAVLTIGILVLMEGLSAFLHTLRLHWMEFQSKFYTGTGYTFQPFSFETILIQAAHSTEE